MPTDNAILLVFSDGSRMEISVPGKSLFRVESSQGSISLFRAQAPPLPRGLGLRILLDQPIEALGLSVRASNKLDNIPNCSQVGQLVQLTEAIILKECRDRKVLDNIKKVLGSLRLSLEMLPEDLDGWKPAK